MLQIIAFWGSFGQEVFLCFQRIYPFKKRINATIENKVSLYSEIEIIPGIKAYMEAMTPPAPSVTNNAGKKQHTKVVDVEISVKNAKKDFISSTYLSMDSRA